MTPEFFAQQLPLLKNRFGEKAFDKGFSELVAREMAALSNEQFRGLVQVMLGTRAHNRPPLLTDFREMKLQIEKRHVDNSFSNVTSLRRPETAKCQTCNDVGSISAMRKDYPHASSYAFGCPLDCEARRTKSLSTPIWSERFSFEFERCV